MTRSRLAALALLLLGLASACGSAHRAVAQPTTIVVHSDIESETTFFAIHADGSGVSRLFSVSDTNTAYVKPDGTKALVVKPGSGSGGSYILDVATGKKHPLNVDGLYDAIEPPDQPWAPHGARLLLDLGNPDYSGDTYVVYNTHAHVATCRRVINGVVGKVHNNLSGLGFV